MAGLARVAERCVADAPQEPIVGPVDITPIQHEFFSLEQANPHHHNQAILLSVAPGVSYADIDAAVSQLFAHHDMLRARYQKGDQGAWTQTVEPVTPWAGLECVDLSAVDDAQLPQAIEALAEKTQTALELERGPVARFVYFDLGADRQARLLIVIHHLVVDAVSWRICWRIWTVCVDSKFERACAHCRRSRRRMPSGRAA